MADYYELLGLERDAPNDEIKRAYRKMARQYHPDVAGEDPSAEARFKEIAVAYETLSDPEKRRRYDMFGEGGPGSGGSDPFGGGLGDIFDVFFGGSDPFGGQRGQAGPPRGQDAEMELELSLVEAVFGCTRTIEVRMPVECGRCDGSGCEPGTHPSTCRTCNGEGQVRQVRRTLLGQMVTARACSDCGGLGKTVQNPCTECRGDGRIQGLRRRDIQIPAGIDDGQRLRSTRNGPAAPRGGVAGDLYLRIRVAPNELYSREGDDLVTRLEIAMTQAALGARITLETLDGPEELTIPAGTQPGRVFRLRGRGATQLQGRGRGDLVVHVDVVIPEKLGADEEDLMRRLAELRGDDVAPADHGLLSKLKSAFK